MSDEMWVDEVLAENEELAQALEERDKEIAKLKSEMDVDRAFYKLTVAERNAAQDRAHRWRGLSEERDARIEELEKQSVQKDAHIEVLWAGGAPQDAIEGVRKTAREEGRREVIDAIQKIINARRCSDGGCLWGRPGGMRTNGGCQTLKMTRPEWLRDLRDLADELNSLVDTQPDKREGDT